MLADRGNDRGFPETRVARGAIDLMWATFTLTARAGASSTAQELHRALRGVRYLEARIAP
jgi:hypothetical protein